MEAFGRRDGLVGVFGFCFILVCGISLIGICI